MWVNVNILQTNGGAYQEKRRHLRGRSCWKTIPGEEELKMLKLVSILVWNRLLLKVIVESTTLAARLSNRLLMALARWSKWFRRKQPEFGLKSCFFRESENSEDVSLKKQVVAGIILLMNSFLVWSFLSDSEIFYLIFLCTTRSNIYFSWCVCMFLFWIFCKWSNEAGDNSFAGEPGRRQAQVSDCSLRGEQQDHGHQHLRSGGEDEEKIV